MTPLATPPMTPFASQNASSRRSCIPAGGAVRIGREIARAERHPPAPAGLVIRRRRKPASGHARGCLREFWDAGSPGAPLGSCSGNELLRGPSFATGVGLWSHAARYAWDTRQREGQLLEGLFAGLGRRLRGLLSR